MAKISLTDTSSGYNLAAINNNFQTLQNALNNGALWRDSPVNEPNQMIGTNLDMNNNRVINLPPPISDNEAARLIDVQEAIAGAKTAVLTQFTPYRDITSTNVQGAIQQEVDARFILADKISRAVYASDFGAVGDGVTDDTNAFVNAFAFLNGPGKVIVTGRHYIGQNLNIPSYNWIDGGYRNVGTSKDNTTIPYNTNKYALILSPVVTIRCNGSAGIDRCLIMRQGMPIPTTNPATFQGTAITGVGDDFFVFDSLIIGFAQAVYSSGFQRPRIRNLNFDCTAGIWIDNCADIGLIEDCHGWPWTSVGTATTTQRTGTAYRFTAIGDWHKVVNCFAYNYYRGFWNSSVNDCIFDNCAVDGAGGFAGQIGFVVDGNSIRTRFVNCTASQQATGAFLGNSNPPYSQTIIDNFDCFSSGSVGIEVDNGDVFIRGGHFNNQPYGISVANNNSTVFIDNVRFSNISTNPIFIVNSGATKVFIGRNDYGDFTGIVANANLGWPTIPSASVLSLPNNGDCFIVSGNNSFGTISGGWAGRRITLLFTGSLTLSNSGGGGGLNIAGGTFTVSSGSTITLVYNGTSTWFETGRKA